MKLQYLMRNETLFEINQKSKELGQIAFSKSSLKDPFIKKIIAHISKETGQQTSEIESKIQIEVDEFDNLYKLAPVLYHTIVLNIVENQVFNALKDVPVKNAPILEVVTFTKLVRMIKQEHSSMFPMKNFYNHETIANPRIILIPSSDEKVMKRFANIDTACATPNGEFVFNKPFMQELLNFGTLKDIKPKGKKYKSNGGEIPDPYAYIEFLIMHEFMHYTYADFHYSKVYKADPTISNWVGDFRSNYDLVKNEHEQLPIGLYNDLVNLDRQKDWKEMYDIIKAEFDKLPKKDQDKVKSKIGEPGGQHGEPGEGEPGGQHGEPDEGEPGEGEPTKEDAEASEKSAREKGNKESELSKETEEEKEAKKSTSTIGGRGKKGPDSVGAIDYTKFSPSMSWKALLAKLVRTSTEEETSYQKPHRRNITRVHTAAQSGSSAMKPGELDIESNLLKLCIVVDSSGSMSGKIEQVYANLSDLIKQHSSEVKLGFVLVKFSNAHKMFMCLPSGKGSYKEIKSIDDKSTKYESGDIKKLFSEHYGSSTNFDSSLTANLDVFVKDNYNVLIISDTDILESSNKNEFEKFFKRSEGKVYFIAGDKNDYHNIIKALKIKSNNITHM